MFQQLPRKAGLPDRRKAAEILYNYAICENGKFAYVHKFKAALLYWSPEKRLFPKLGETQ
ncbi:hypothetical protein [Paenibacillus sp. EPM92]|uniref:hypothetical protein n=1 Tax=Paenibacillus sp. EPM92 TaxID=1561195 RepID=UPI0006CFCAD7|nr:hypothetical protein [Paenibacillus sp. EPM92]